MESHYSTIIFENLRTKDTDSYISYLIYGAQETIFHSIIKKFVEFLRRIGFTKAKCKV